MPLAATLGPRATSATTTLSRSLQRVAREAGEDFLAPRELLEQLHRRKRNVQEEADPHADLIGFQVPGAAANYLRLVKRFLGWETRRQEFLRPRGSRGRAAAYPISIDAETFGQLARRPDVAARSEEIRRDLGVDTIFLGVDRLDYTKGIGRRVQAFGEQFREGELDPASAVFLQVATPSRVRVEEYRRLADDIDRLVGRINGTLGDLSIHRGRPGTQAGLAGQSLRHRRHETQHHRGGAGLTAREAPTHDGPAPAGGPVHHRPLGRPVPARPHAPGGAVVMSAGTRPLTRTRTTSDRQPS